MSSPLLVHEMRKSLAASLVQGLWVACLSLGEDLWRERLLLMTADASVFVWVADPSEGGVYWEDYQKSEHIKDLRLVALAGGGRAGVTGKTYPGVFVPSSSRPGDWWKEAVAVFNYTPASDPVDADAAAVGDGDTAPMKTGKGKVRTGKGGFSTDLVEYLRALEGGEEWAKVAEAEASRKAAVAKADTTELDARLLLVSMWLGRRQWAWDSVVTDSSEIPVDSRAVDGSSVALWVIMLLARFEGGGPEVYHRWWMNIIHLVMAVCWVAEHSQGLVEWIVAELQKTSAITEAAWKAHEVRSLAKTTVSCEQPSLLAYLPPTADKADKAGKGGGKKE